MIYKLNKNYSISSETIESLPYGHSSFEHSPQWEADEPALIEKGKILDSNWREEVHFFSTGGNVVIWFVSTHGTISNVMRITYQSDMGITSIKHCESM